MARNMTQRRIHAVNNNDHRDKFILGMAFVVGVVGGVAMKVFGVHPFAAAAFSAGVLAAYAMLSYWSSSLRLDPEVIGDNSYYLGFLFTLTSLSVTLYFVVQAGVEQRAQLIPEVISGFGVALVSTICGVFIRVLMMQFRVDLVARERETRVELDDVARRLRVELAQSVERVKAFTVESLQHAAERDATIRRTTDDMVKGMHGQLLEAARLFQVELSKTISEQSQVAVAEIRASVASASEASLTGIRSSFGALAQVAADMHSSNENAGKAVHQSLALLQSHGNDIATEVGRLKANIIAMATETKDAGAGLVSSVLKTAKSLEASIESVNTRLGTGFEMFDQSARDASLRSQDIINGVAEKLHASVRNLSSVAEAERTRIEQSIAGNTAPASNVASGLSAPSLPDPKPWMIKR